MWLILPTCKLSLQSTNSLCADDWLNHRVHTRVAMAIFWRTFHHYGKISPAWRGWGVHALPLKLYLPSQAKLLCTVRSSVLCGLNRPCSVNVRRRNYFYNHTISQSFAVVRAQVDVIIKSFEALDMQKQTVFPYCNFCPPPPIDLLIDQWPLNYI